MNHLIVKDGRAGDRRVSVPNNAFPYVEGPFLVFRDASNNVVVVVSADNLVEYSSR